MTAAAKKRAVISSGRAERPRESFSPKKHWGKNLLVELGFLGIILLCFLTVKILPFLLSFGYAFTDWNGISSQISFTGVDNYVQMLADKDFWNSLWFTLRFCGCSILLTNVLGFFLAYCLNKPLRMRGILRAGFYIPNVLGGLVLGFIWQFIFTKVFPAIGKATGIGFFNLMWLGTPATSFWGLVMVDVWCSLGYYMLLYLAGLSAIPSDCLEAAHIDGAGGWQTLTRVTLPLLMPTITRCLFLSITSSFRVYTLNMSLTNGGPYLSSEAITMNIYRTAFTENQMGYGSAKSLVFMLIVVAITGIQVALTSRKEVSM